MKKSWWIGNYEVTVRELLASITIVAVMTILGFVFAGKIEEHQMDKNAEYYKAAKITKTEMFQYGMDTSVGNAFVYGDLEAVDTVTYPEIGGAYLYVEKVEEHYNKHTRTVKSGKATIIQTYYTWDYAGREEVHSQKIRFCGIEMDYSKVGMPGADYIDTIKQSSHVRFKYYGCQPKYTGTVYTDLRDGAMKDDSSFYAGQDIESTVEHLTSELSVVLFWLVWAILTGCAVVGFVCLNNDWLEDGKK
ncbi:MAG: hypothetical protein Q4F24_07985 [Eubacteriales bacterium]|nr:hypothetical protein [Eubacteriales bacterium]